MNLPKAERRVPEYNLNHVRLWFYGLPFSGKTTLADAFPMPLMLNTDGNAKNATSQVITIADEVTVEGRQTKRKFAWDVFKEAITELEKGGNGFETVVVDLIEDVYESCRLYMYDKLKISHEGDDPYKAWDKIRTEYLSNIRRLMVLPYNIILISHEDDSKDITKKTGDKVTAIKPNIAEKVALKLAGMVDVVIRVVADDGVYKLTFKADDVVFGGGRINLSGVTEIPNDYETLINIVKANKATQTKAKPVREEIKPVPIKEEIKPVPIKEEVEKEDQPVEEEKPKRQRRVRKEEPAPGVCEGEFKFNDVSGLAPGQTTLLKANIYAAPGDLLDGTSVANISIKLPPIAGGLFLAFSTEIFAHNDHYRMHPTDSQEYTELTHLEIPIRLLSTSLVIYFIRLA